MISLSTHNSKTCVPKSTKSFIFYQKDLSQKIDTGKQNRWSVYEQADLRLCCSHMTKHDVTHFQIDRSYLCRIRRKEFVASNFMAKKKKQLLIYHSGCHFCRGFLENKFALNSSIYVRNGTMRLLV